MSRLIFLIVLFTPCLAYATTIHKSGPSGDRMDLVLLAEGYSANQEALFNKHARSILNTMKTHKPFDRYLALMNVHTGFRAARSNGLSQRSHTNYQTYRVGGTVMRAANSAKILTDAQYFAPEADRILVICNATKKGGTAYGTYGFVTTHGWFEFTAIHELGHMMSGLADEYVNTQRAYQLTRHLDSRPGNLVDHVKTFLKSKLARRTNVSPYGERHMLPWKIWVDGNTPVPGTRDTQGVSAFEG
ncbi:MAG: M64 family metallopeptidase, partial [Planctomycetota bacterium]|nr:M64 family metallopeptidase [Planctomycetota bacterium]